MGQAQEVIRRGARVTRALLTRRRLILSGVALIGGVLVLTWLSTASAEFCSDVVALEEESQSDFDAIRREAINQATGEWATSFALAEADSCSLFVDPERSSYICEWAYPDEASARMAYDKTLAAVSECLSDDASGLDQPVNHPDFWQSAYFDMPGGDLRVSLKVKNTLKQVFVSLQLSQERA